MRNLRIVNFKRKTESMFFVFAAAEQSDWFVKAFGLWKIEDFELQEPTIDSKHGYGVKLVNGETKEVFEETFNKIKKDLFEYTRHNNGAPTLSKDFLIRAYEDERLQKSISRSCDGFGDSND